MHFEVVLEFWYLVLHIFIKVTSSPLLLHIRYTIVSYVLIMSFDQESNIVKMKPLRVNIKKMKFEPKTLSENTSKEIIVISDDEEDCLDTNKIHLHLNCSILRGSLRAEKCLEGIKRREFVKLTSKSSFVFIRPERDEVFGYYGSYK